VVGRQVVTYCSLHLCPAIHPLKALPVESGIPNTVEGTPGVSEECRRDENQILTSFMDESA
jgi:hypothetical protein